MTLTDVLALVAIKLVLFALARDWLTDPERGRRWRQRLAAQRGLR